MPTGKEPPVYYYENANGEKIEIKEVNFSDSIDEIQGDILNYEAWKLISELMEKAGFELVPSKKTAKKIADEEAKNLLPLGCRSCRKYRPDARYKGIIGMCEETSKTTEVGAICGSYERGRQKWLQGEEVEE